LHLAKTIFEHIANANYADELLAILDRADGGCGAASLEAPTDNSLGWQLLVSSKADAAASVAPRELATKTSCPNVVRRRVSVPPI
jgi:hypothetical protein